MPNYVVLMNWTEQGVRNAKDAVDRYEAGRSELEAVGVRLRETLWTIGPYDIVNLIEAPDDETLSAALLALAGLGNVRTVTMRAFDSGEMRRVLGRIP
jgi:uncharacterized protein with GYD domain